MRKIIKLFSIITIMVMIMTACQKKETVNLTWMPATNVEQQITEYKEDGVFEDAVVEEDMSSMTITLTPKQRKNWLTQTKQEIQNYVQKSNQEEHMNIKISDDYQEFVVNADSGVSLNTIVEYYLIVGYDLEVVQVLSDESDWRFTFIINDLDSGKELLRKECPGEEFEFSKEMWTNQ